MSDIKLFRTKAGKATELKGTSVALEKSLQTLIEANLDALLGVRFVKTEHITGAKHGGRIDTLGIDENNCPVIIEYKRDSHENVITQGLFYLSWLMDHKADFEILVLKKLGQKVADEINFKGARLLCVAGGFNKFDEHAAEIANRNIELIRYKRFGEDLLLLEHISVSPSDLASPSKETSKPKASKTTKAKTFSEYLAQLDTRTRDLYEHLKTFLTGIGDDAQVKVLEQYVAFKRLKNFACVEVFPSDKKIKMFVKVDPKSVRLEDGFTRDVTKLGHYGTGDLEITIRSMEDLERAKPFVLKSYEQS
ncbi:MAG: DUF5655 domain-containing protein [Flavobacteriales bacterium]